MELHRIVQIYCHYDVWVASADYPGDSAVQKGEISNGKYAVFTISHTTKAVPEFWCSVIEVLQKENLKYDVLKPIMEYYKSKLIEDSKCKFCISIVE